MPSDRFLHEWPFTRDSIVHGHLSWKKSLAEPDSKAVNVMGREMTNIFICAFKVGSFETLLSGSFFNAGDWEQKNHE